MSEKTKRPWAGQWYVKHHVGGLGWVPISDSIDRSKSYALGYLNALCSFNPHPEYRLIDKDGCLFEFRSPTSGCGPHHFGRPISGDALRLEEGRKEVPMIEPKPPTIERESGSPVATFPGTFSSVQIVHYEWRERASEMIASRTHHETSKIVGMMEPGKTYTIRILKTVEPERDSYSIGRPPQEWSQRHTTRINVGTMEDLIDRMRVWAHRLGPPLGPLDGGVSADIWRCVNSLQMQEDDRKREEDIELDQFAKENACFDGCSVFSIGSSSLR